VIATVSNLRLVLLLLVVYACQSWRSHNAYAMVWNMRYTRSTY